MGAVQPRQGRPWQARAVSRTLRQPPRRRWGRPLVVGLVLVVVAALVPGAGAEESGTLADPGLAEPGMLAATEQATELTEAYDPQASLEVGTPGSPAAAAGAGGDAGGETGSDGGERTGEQEQQPTQDQEPPVAVAEVRPEGQQRDGQPDLAATDAPGAAGRGPGGDRDAAATGGAGTDGEPAAGRQGEPATVGQDQAGGPGGCISGCSTQPPNSGDATVAAAGGWSLRGIWNRVSGIWNRVSGLGRGQPQEPAQQEPAREEAQEPAQRPLEPTVVMDLIRGDLTRVVERRQQLVAEGGTRSQSDLDAARLLLQRARGGVEYLHPQVGETPEGAQLAALTRQVEELAQALGEATQQVLDINDPNVDLDTLDQALTQALEGPSRRNPGRIDEVTWSLGILEGALTQRGFPQRWATAGEQRRDQALVEQVRRDLEELRSELAESAQEQVFRTLTGRFELVQERLAREAATTPWQGTVLDLLEARVAAAEIQVREAAAGSRQLLQDASADLAALRTDLETRGALEAAGPVGSSTHQRWVELGQRTEAAATSVSGELEAWAASPPMIQADEIISSLQAGLALRGGERWATAQERSLELAELERARAVIEELRAQVTEETPQADQRRVAALTARFQAMEERLDSEPATHWQGTELDRLEAAIRRAEQFQRWDEDPAPPTALFRSREAALEDATGRIRQLRAEVTRRDPRSGRFRDLTERFQQQQWLLAYDRLARPQPPGEGQRMSAVDPEDVAGTPRDPSLKDKDKALVTGTVGFPSPDPEQPPVAGAVGFPSPKRRDEQLVTAPTGGKVLTDRERALITGNPGVTATKLDTRPLLQQDTAQATSETWAAATDVAVQTGKAAPGLAAGVGGVGLLYALLMKTQVGQALLLVLSPDVRKALPWMAPGPPPG
jgi:hypothetical protein